MDNENNIKDMLSGIPGLKPLDAAMLAELNEFKRAMSEEVIPSIVETVEKRHLAATAIRHLQLK
ncbi:MAG: hypothetical protein ACXWJK_08865 [Burkholderiaceae bacterium]